MNTPLLPEPPGYIRTDELIRRHLPPGLIRRSQFRHLIPFATNTIAKMMAEQKFPPPNKHASSARLYIWNSADIEAWLNGQWRP